jgi:hypothetical protein
MGKVALGKVALGKAALAGARCLASPAAGELDARGAERERRADKGAQGVQGGKGRARAPMHLQHNAGDVC